jgi:hypothetical protein
MQHWLAAKHWRRHRKQKDEEEEGILKSLCGKVRTATARRMLRSKETGIWLTAMPNTMNGT